ncbi:cation:proton antiporter [Avibacterium paragallinarum]|uniref:Sodium:proton antiporter n=4 Tax=Avibacterium paragallinarum TaxID=728 RepID=A0AAE5TJ80_AVIPA|nr:sodium:proton antiporter [Avibacterium paragallinarum]MEE3609631.1 sodium:proton antiporter [Avibacterium paragallinarum]MEE3621566.1 sodium:proton antiporter [Avibacterium paragallinarum]MEE3669307.1 sodium:proton antiporter [Avibacterium paragallinarum]MEE3681737.1 sodium:proton antiporter [Avibacterium paragallinarum]MEE4386995.1 sodium:proton antiporter [Avibacterium paragallinarum]
MDTAFILSAIVGLGIVAQWLAWYLKQPSILFLLLIGIVVGPVLNLFNPDAILGDLLFPFISLGVAVILFEGALTLEFDEIKQHGKVVQLLVSLGMLITVSVISIATYFLFEVDWRIALLFGTLVCVTGPTVIVPLLRSVRPNSNIANILKWEGIIIDPIGAIAVVLVYEYIISGGQASEIGTFAKIIAVAGIIGLVGAWVLANLIKRHMIPEYLRNVFVLAYILLLFTASNHLAHESGLLTVTVLGVALANWKGFPKDHILEFKESLTVLLISTLFIILAARVNLAHLVGVGMAGILLLFVAMFIARPLAIWASSIGSRLSFNEKLMISWIGPRGIVAAAISSLFAIKLQDTQLQGVELLVPLVFTIIIGTVLIQGLGAKAIAKLLNVQEAVYKGVLIIGSNPVALAIATSLKEQNVDVLVASRHYNEVAKARMLGLRTYYGNPVSTHADGHLDLIGLGNMFAISTDKELNTLSEIHYRHEFDKNNIYRIRFSDDSNQTERYDIQDNYRSNWLFGKNVTYAKLASMLAKNARIKVTNLTDSYTYQDYKATNKQFVPLYTIDDKGFITIINNEDTIPTNCRIVALVAEEETAKSA